jgi:transposase
LPVPPDSPATLGTLGNWVAKYRDERAEDEPPLSMSERARLRELEREVRELRMKNEFLGKAAAFFAQEYRCARNTSSSTRRGRTTRSGRCAGGRGVSASGFYDWRGPAGVGHRRAPRRADRAFLGVDCDENGAMHPYFSPA